jgi:hypothetical protein
MAYNAIRIPQTRVSIPRPRAILPYSTNVPGQSVANVVANVSPVGAVDAGSSDAIGDLGRRISSETAAMRAAHSVDVAGLMKSIKASQSGWKPPVAGLIGPLSVTGGRPSPGHVKLAGGVDQWIAQAYKILGIPLTPQALADERYLIQHESGGNPRAINRWDINAKRGTPSEGLEQTIMPTFQRYKLPGYNDIFNPIHNILASLRYRKATKGRYDIGRYSGGY